MRAGIEDDDAFHVYDFGFADLIRRPTATSKGLSQAELLEGARNLASRLDELGDRPRIVFTFKSAWAVAERPLAERGYEISVMPSPYAAKDLAHSRMLEIQKLLKAR